MEDQSIQEIFNQLFFLRPQALWALVPVVLIGLLMLFRKRDKENWKKRFPEEMLVALKIESKGSSDRSVRIFSIIGMAIAVLAVAGPTWKQVDKPGGKTESALVIALDVSLSMKAQDIQPSRLERAKMKVKDFLDANPGTKSSLLVYAGTAHVAVPFTKDYRLLTTIMDAVKPEIMPYPGSNLEEALEYADSLLIPLEAPSTLLLITDDFSEENNRRLAQFSSKHRVEVMALGTPGGASVRYEGKVLKNPDGSDALMQMDTKALGELNNYENIGVVTLTLDESDVKVLAKRISDSLEYQLDPETAEMDWVDAGYWLLFPVLFVLLISFRRGWYINWCLAGLMLMNTSCSDSPEDQDWWYTRDQQGKILYEQGKYEEAAERFENEEWRARSYLEAGDTLSAITAYSESATAEGFYNAGLLMAEKGDYEGALQAMKAAQSIDPDIGQVAQNLEQLDEMIVDTTQVKEDLVELNADNLQEATLDVDELGTDKNAQEAKVKKEGGQKTIDMGEKRIAEDQQTDQIAIPTDPQPQKEEARQTLLRMVKSKPEDFLDRKFRYQAYMRYEKGIIKPSSTIW